MSFRRVSVVSLTIALCVALLAALVPAGVLAAQDGKVREYIVTIKVKDSGRTIKPTNRANKVRIRQRAKAADEASGQIAKRNGVKARHRYGNVITGFSARMTKAEARKLAKDPKVTSITASRVFRIAAESVPVGIKRVKAYQGSPQPDVDANVAVIDTGIGPLSSDELEIAGGWNCFGTPPLAADYVVEGVYENGEDNPAFQADTDAFRGLYGDVNGHGTHVAGTIGARANNVGVVGVAPGVNLYSVRVFGAGGGGTDATVLCGLDWIADTHTPGLTPGVSPIDVVNMSIQGNRPNMLEDCDLVGTDPDGVGPLGPDLMHEAICELRKIGVPVVAAAGNSAEDANLSSPGGYNAAISVGAMTDTDGVGWEDGSNASCSGYTGEKDDTFASYSNYGTDVDIVAPGTCVWSTWYGDPTGAQLARLTGTSMAAPHVTGAIARYIDEKGSLSTRGEVDTLRQRIRAAGRMDWDARTDPVWDGVNDLDPPNRVLDVTALTGGNAVKTFVYHESLTLNSTHTSRATRVDVQRSGGYEGEVSFSADITPSWIGSISFDQPSISGLGPDNLGTNVNFTPSTGTEDKLHTVTITSDSGVGSHSRNLALTIDRTLPKVSDLGPKVRGSRTAVTTKGATQVYLQWTASDAFSGLKSAQLQRKIGTAAWKNAGVAGASTARVWLKPGQANKFRVRVTDNAGNSGTSAAVSGRLSIRDSKNGAINKIGTWKTKQTNKAYGGSLIFATTGTATLKTKFDGKAVAIMAPIGRGRGKFRVRVDGGAWQTVNTKASSGAQRRVVWTSRLSNGNHKLEIQRVSGKPAIDGLIFVR